VLIRQKCWITPLVLELSNTYLRLILLGDYAALMEAINHS
jgi:hypothetical protein